MTQWEGIPEFIQGFMLDEQQIQGNVRDSSIFKANITASKEEGGFDWATSSLGSPYWIKVLSQGIFELPDKIWTTAVGEKDLNQWLIQKYCYDKRTPDYVKNNLKQKHGYAYLYHVNGTGRLKYPMKTSNVGKTRFVSPKFFRKVLEEQNEVFIEDLDKFIDNI